MPGTLTHRGVGIACALLAGCAILYLGLRAVAPAGPHESNNAPPAPASPTAVEKDTHEARILEDALKKKPQHAPVLFRMAQLAETSGDNAKAAEHLREILRQEPGNQDALLELGKVLYQLGDVSGALEQTNALLKLKPDHPDALYNLGAIYGNLGDVAMARGQWTRLVAVNPQSESAKRARSMLEQLPAGAGSPEILQASRTTKDVSSK